MASNPEKIKEKTNVTQLKNDPIKPAGKKNAKAAQVVMNFDKCSNLHIGNNYFNSYVQSNEFKAYNAKSKTKKENVQCDKPSSVQVPQNILDSQQKLNYELQYYIAENIGKKWRKMALFLPPDGIFKDADLDIIEYKHRDDLRSVVYEVLSQWNERAPEDATVGTLAKTLQKINCSEIAADLVHYLK